jgi:hypothetical protein
MAGEREVLREISARRLDHRMGKPDIQHLSGEVQKALRHLHKAHEFALDVQLDIWQFAEPLRNLVAMGVPEPALRWLVVKGYAEHAHELTTFSEADRRFRPSPNVSFGPKTRFVITEAGAEFMRDNQEEASASIVPFRTQAAVVAPMPYWDARMRTLYFGDQIVKRYRQPAANQEKVLLAFEEGAWTHIIDDPLPFDPEACAEMRLRDTIRRLNSNQANRLVHFYGDGSGLRVAWETVEQATLPAEAARRKARLAA